MLGELIGEFKGRNTVYRVLPDGEMETSSQGTGKILGIDAFVMSTAVGTMTNGVFAGEEYSVITIMEGDTVFFRANVIGFPSEKGGSSRAGSYQMTQSEKLKRLNKVICVHEYETDMNDNWTGKIWSGNSSKPTEILLNCDFLRDLIVSDNSNFARSKRPVQLWVASVNS